MWWKSQRRAKKKGGRINAHVPMANLEPGRRPFGGRGATAVNADPIPAVAEASNMQIVGHSDLKGAGKGGEGLALRQYPNGQRVLFLAHESAPMCFTVIDVTKPEDPKVIAQIPVGGCVRTLQLARPVRHDAGGGAPGRDGGPALCRHGRI